MLTHIPVKPQVLETNTSDGFNVLERSFKCLLFGFRKTINIKTFT